MSIDKKALLESMRGLIVSCQTEPHDPIHDEGRTVVTMAKAAEYGGAVGIRSNKPEQVAAIHAAVKLPIVGLHKIYYDTVGEVIMTPTIEHAKALYEAGAQIIALDSTQRLNQDGVPRCDLIKEIKREIPDALIFADIDTYENAEHAIELGADIVATTCMGGTPESKALGYKRPDYAAVARLAKGLKDRAFVVMEGHIETPEDAIKAFYMGVDAIVVGSAITRPHLVVKKFTDAINRYTTDWHKDEAIWFGDVTEKTE